MTSIAGQGRIPAPSPQGKALAARRTRAQIADRTMTGVLWAIVAGLVALLAYFILYTIVKGIGVVNWTFITGNDVAGDYDGPEVFNTFYILILALIVCVPIGVGGAIYLIEYARQNFFTVLVRFASETLAGIPTLIVGFFGFLIFVQSTQSGGLGWGRTRIAGALTLAVLNLPLLIRVSQDAMLSVPNELREASAALGATKSQTIFRVLLPSAIPQLATGIILTAGKMIGETAALVFTAGTTSPFNGWHTLNPFIAGDTLTVHLYELQAEGIAKNGVQLQEGTAALLIIFLLIFNLGFRGLAALLNRRFAGSR